MCFVLVLPNSPIGHRIMHSQERAFEKGGYLLRRTGQTEALLAACSSVPPSVQDALTFRRSDGRGWWQCDTIPDDGLSGRDPCQAFSLGKVEELGCKTALGRMCQSSSPHLQSDTVWWGSHLVPKVALPTKQLRVNKSSSFIGLFIPKTHSKAQGLDYKRPNHFGFA